MEENFLFNTNNIDNNNYIKERYISYKIKSFNNIIDKLITNVKKISKILSKQIIGSNFLIKEIMIEKQYSKTITQLYDRIGMLEDSRRLLEENIKSINYNIKHFFKEIDKEFLFDNNKINNINIKEYNNNIQYKTLFNNNFIKQSKTFDDLNYQTINKSKSNNKTNYENYVSSLKKIKKHNSSISPNSINEKEFNENNLFKNNLNYIYNNNKNKKSRNAKLIHSYHPSLNAKNTSNTIINKNNYINKTSTIISNNKRVNKINENYSIILAKNVIKFLNLIKEMKMKYNKKDSIYNSEFKKVKLLYDKLKIYIMNLSKKVIDIYSINNPINKKKNNNNINSKEKENTKIKKISENNKNKNNNDNLLKIKKINLLTENIIHFSYIINQAKKEHQENKISKEISLYFLEEVKIKLNNSNFTTNISQIHETELIILKKDNESIKDDNIAISELQEKIKILTEELNKYKKDISIDTENKNEESKVDKEQIELLLNENQELKNKIEEYKESNNMSVSNSKEDMEKYYKEIINENESKIKFLTEKNIFYENEIKKYKENNNNKENTEIINLKVENSIIQKEFEDLKKQNHFLNEKINEYKIENNLEDIIPDKYDIICDKNYKKLSWILLRQKDIIEENEYENYIWVEKNLVNNLDLFNFITEEESIKRQIMNYITQLEEKDDIIFKLKQKLNKFEKSDE